MSVKEKETKTKEIPKTDGIKEFTEAIKSDKELIEAYKKDSETGMSQALLKQFANQFAIAKSKIAINEEHIKKIEAAGIPNAKAEPHRYALYMAYFDEIKVWEAKIRELKVTAVTKGVVANPWG